PPGPGTPPQGVATAQFVTKAQRFQIKSADNLNASLPALRNCTKATKRTTTAGVRQRHATDAAAVSVVRRGLIEIHPGRTRAGGPRPLCRKQARRAGSRTLEFQCRVQSRFPEYRVQSEWRAHTRVRAPRTGHVSCRRAARAAFCANGTTPSGDGNDWGTD